MKHLKLFESYNDLDRLIQIRMDKIFDTIEEYKTESLSHSKDTKFPPHIQAIFFSFKINI